MTQQKPKLDEDWQRFERAVDIALKTPAKHKVVSHKKKTAKTPKK